MSDPETPSREPTPGASTQPESTGYAVALECVQLVIAWYNRAIYAEQRSPSPDTDRLATLIAERRACVADRKSLSDANAADIARVARNYGALFRQLTAD